MAGEIGLFGGVRLRRAYQIQTEAERARAQLPDLQTQDSFSVQPSGVFSGPMAPSMFVPPPSERNCLRPQGYSPSTALCGIVRSLLQRFLPTIMGGLSRMSGGFDDVLNDPALTVEDKVTLMIMQIMKKMDREIELQAIRIQMIQTQQGIGKAASGALSMVPMFGGAGSIAGGLFEAASPSIDVETMKLKRLIDKRSQMFDMLRQIIDKYNQTAKGIIDSQSR